MHIEILDTLEKLDRFKPCWDELLERYGADSPFITHEWISTMWRSLEEKTDLIVCVAKENDEICALAPLMRGREKLRGMPVGAVKLIGDYYSDWTEILLFKRELACLRAIFDEVARRYPHDLCILRSIIKGSRTDTMLKSMADLYGMPYAEYPGSFSPYIPIAGSWEEFFKSRSKNVRHTMRRVANLFGREPGCEIVRHEGGEIGRAYEELLAVDRNSWQYAEGTGLGIHPERKRFYAALARVAARRGWTVIWILRLRGTPIAFQYGLRYKNILHTMKTGYDERYARMAPGKYLITHVVRYCHENGLSECNFMGDNDPYKMEFTSYCRPHRKYYLFGNTLKGVLLSLLERKAVPIARAALAGLKTGKSIPEYGQSPASGGIN